ncbi:MAG: metallophosphoesterase family protein [Caldilineaceae bacterium]
MRIAILSDIHGNLTALDAVLAELAQAQIDQYLCLGDVIEHGPQPRATLARVLALHCPIVMGNTDERMLTDYQAATPPSPIRPGYEQDVWSAAQLTETDRDAIRAFTPTILLTPADGVTLLAFHGSPRSNNEFIGASLSDDILGERLGGFRATIMVGGHSHEQMLRRYGDTVVVNPGSVGAPFLLIKDGPQRPAWAEYIVMDVQSRAQIRIDFRRTPFDVAQHLQAYAESDMPHKQLWIKEWLENSNE